MLLEKTWRSLLTGMLVALAPHGIAPEGDPAGQLPTRYCVIELLASVTVVGEMLERMEGSEGEERRLVEQTVRKLDVPRMMAGLVAALAALVRCACLHSLHAPGLARANVRGLPPRRMHSLPRAQRAPRYCLPTTPSLPRCPWLQDISRLRQGGQTRQGHKSHAANGCNGAPDPPRQGKAGLALHAVAPQLSQRASRVHLPVAPALLPHACTLTRMHACHCASSLLQLQLQVKEFLDSGGMEPILNYLQARRSCSRVCGAPAPLQAAQLNPSSLPFFPPVLCRWRAQRVRDCGGHGRAGVQAPGDLFRPDGARGAPRGEHRPARARPSGGDNAAWVPCRLVPLGSCPAPAPASPLLLRAVAQAAQEAFGARGVGLCLRIMRALPDATALCMDYGPQT